MKYQISEPRFFIGQTVKFTNHRKQNATGEIIGIQTQYSYKYGEQREKIFMPYHIYSIKIWSNKRLNHVDENQIIALNL